MAWHFWTAIALFHILVLCKICSSLPRVSLSWHHATRSAGRVCAAKSLRSLSRRFVSIAALLSFAHLGDLSSLGVPPTRSVLMITRIRYVLTRRLLRQGTERSRRPLVLHKPPKTFRTGP
ncbi:hypothetical protein BS17DRAFT_784506 [Gyrodon lividus]|nr:hypothetical protein BS17DRAFT_784506 [Gyrodon lividus]